MYLVSFYKLRLNFHAYQVSNTVFLTFITASFITQLDFGQSLNLIASDWQLSYVGKTELQELLHNNHFILLRQLKHRYRLF